MGVRSTDGRGAADAAPMILTGLMRETDLHDGSLRWEGQDKLPPQRAVPLQERLHVRIQTDSALSQDPLRRLAFESRTEHLHQHVGGLRGVELA